MCVKMIVLCLVLVVILEYVECELNCFCCCRYRFEGLLGIMESWVTSCWEKKKEEVYK